MLREGKYMHNTHMCSFQGSSLFIPVNTTNFIPNHHQSHGIKSHRIASHYTTISESLDSRPSAVLSALFAQGP